MGADPNDEVGSFGGERQRPNDRVAEGPARFDHVADEHLGQVDDERGRVTTDLSHDLLPHRRCPAGSLGDARRELLDTLLARGFDRGCSLSPPLGLALLEPLAPCSLDELLDRWKIVLE